MHSAVGAGLLLYCELFCLSLHWAEACTICMSQNSSFHNLSHPAAGGCCLAQLKQDHGANAPSATASVAWNQPADMMSYLQGDPKLHKPLQIAHEHPPVGGVP